MTAAEFAVECVRLYVDACPDDPEVVRFLAALDELREMDRGDDS